MMPKKGLLPLWRRERRSGLKPMFQAKKSPLRELLSTRTRYRELEYSDEYSREFLDKKATQGDPLADELITQMDRDDLLKGAWRDLIGVVIKEAETRGGIYQQFVDYCYAVPDWVDFSLMKASQQMVFTKIPNTLFTGAITFFGGSFVPSALSVAASSQFVEEGGPRLIESGTFILKPALGMKPGSIAHYELMRVRVIHGAVRFFMNKKRGQHLGDGLLNDDAYINQCQLAYFLTSFSFIHLRTAIRMGMKLSDEEIKSHHHRWQYMGYLLGVDLDLLTDSIEEEKKLALSVLKREVNPNITDTFFVEMIKDMVDELGENRSQKFRDKTFLEFKAVLLYAIGEDFIGGWGMSMDEPGVPEALKRAKRRIAIIDFFQRQKPIAMLQYYIVKKQFLSGRKKLLLSIETTGGEDTLGNVGQEKKPRSPMLKKFDAAIARLELR